MTVIDDVAFAALQHAIAHAQQRLMGSELDISLQHLLEHGDKSCVVVFVDPDVSDLNQGY